VTFRDRLLATLRAISPILDEPGIMVIGSEVPNLLQAGAAATLVVSQDVDIGVPLAVHSAVKNRLPELEDLHQHPEEPSVLVPSTSEMIEVNFIGIDPGAEIDDAYVFEDDDLPLMVFGALGLIRAGAPVVIDDLAIPVPRPAGLILEKLLTERTGVKGDRDLLVALGMLMVASRDDLCELADEYGRLTREARHAVRSNLTVLSLLEPLPQMPDPVPERERITTVLAELESREREEM
jgi:hypothetical protein